MTFDVQFSLDAAAELLRITEVIGSTVVAFKAAESIRHQLEDDPAGRGEFLSEGLYYIDHAPLRAFFLIDVDFAHHLRRSASSAVKFRTCQSSSPVAVIVEASELKATIDVQHALISTITARSEFQSRRIARSMALRQRSSG